MAAGKRVQEPTDRLSTGETFARCSSSSVNPIVFQGRQLTGSLSKNKCRSVQRTVLFMVMNNPLSTGDIYFSRQTYEQVFIYIKNNVSSLFEIFTQSANFVTFSFDFVSRKSITIYKTID